MDDIMKLEIHGSILLITGMILVLIWSYYILEWWASVFGFLTLFFLIEAIWHYCIADYKRMKKDN
ncbi:MAG: hypothetical protein CEE43_13855 [Promethearchaeota archaeon Loki_b32]|nr:MAG: hypothetical protein CEE43_13855 [Candidatus Lokiarchaeota archaeon Loki_b32]